jgi:hypothetical protein
MVNLLNSEPAMPARGAGRARDDSIRQRRGQRGALTTELIVAMAILTVASLPLAFSVAGELKALKASYIRALAMEIVDGEMEVLVAGEWQSFSQGAQPYVVRAASATNLPPGKFTLTLNSKRIRLEWAPDKRNRGGKVVREATAR